MNGHLELVVARGSDGTSYVREQSFRAPMHLSKPYWDGQTLIINAINMTAGVFPEDEVRCRVEVESGASAVFTAPSATRIHRSMGGVSRLDQTVRVHNGAWLEVFPEILIPQAESRCVVRSRIEVDSGGGLLWIESLAPGRVASYEAFAFDSLEWETELRVDGEVQVREFFVLSGEGASTNALRKLYPQSYYAGVIVVMDHEAPDFPKKVIALKGVTAGASRRGPRTLLVKILAPGSVALRAALDELRSLVYASIGRIQPSLRRS